MVYLINHLMKLKRKQTQTLLTRLLSQEKKKIHRSGSSGSPESPATLTIVQEQKRCQLQHISSLLRRQRSSSLLEFPYLNHARYNNLAEEVFLGWDQFYEESSRRLEVSSMRVSSYIAQRLGTRRLVNLERIIELLASANSV